MAEPTTRPESATTVSAPPANRWAALGRALLGGLVFAIGFGIANGIGLVIVSPDADPSPVQRLLAAALTTLLIGAGVLLLARRLGVSWADFGVSRRRALRDWASGLAVCGGVAVIVFGITALAGGIRITGVALPALAAFLITTLVIATLLEAFPEELVFRGWSYSALRSGFGVFLAGLFATVIFLLAPGVSQIVIGLIARAAGRDEPIYTFAPEGQDAISYAVLLTCWSVCLIAARRWRGSIWTGVGAHLMLLVVVRLLQRPNTGVAVSLGSEWVLLLIPVYVLLCALAFALLRRRASRLSTSPATTRAKSTTGGSGSEDTE